MGLLSSFSKNSLSQGRGNDAFSISMTTSMSNEVMGSILMDAGMRIYTDVLFFVDREYQVPEIRLTELINAFHLKAAPVEKLVHAEVRPPAYHLAHRIEDLLKTRDHLVSAFKMVHYDDVAAPLANPLGLGYDLIRIRHHAYHVGYEDVVERVVVEGELHGVHLEKLDVFKAQVRDLLLGLFKHLAREVYADHLAVAGEDVEGKARSDAHVKHD